MTDNKKVLFNGPVLKVEQDELGTHLKDQWGRGVISAHAPTSELREALTVFISAVEGLELQLIRRVEEVETEEVEETEEIEETQIMSQKTKQKVGKFFDLFLSKAINPNLEIPPEHTRIFEMASNQQYGNLRAAYFVAFGEEPSIEQGKEGTDLASLLLELHASKCLDGLGGGKKLNEIVIPERWKDLCASYLSEEKDGTDCMLESMLRLKREKENDALST